MNKQSQKREKIISLSKTTLLVLPLLIFILLFTLIPIFHTFIKSLRAPISIHNRDNYNYNFNNYIGIVSDANFQHAVLNSTMVLILGSGISIILSLFFAFIINGIVSKFTKQLFLSLLYSQFFISGFAIGIAFTLFFGNNNLFFYILGLNKYSFTSGNNRLPIWLYYSIFQIWRSLPFNLILFAASFSRGDIKYKKLMTNDNITINQKFRYVYLPEISKVFFAIIFTNFIFSTLLLPSALLDSTFDVDVNYAHTLTSYTIKYLGYGSNPSLHFEKGYASAFFSFIYLVSLLVLLQLFRSNTIKKFIRLLKRKKVKRYEV